MEVTQQERPREKLPLSALSCLWPLEQDGAGVCSPARAASGGFRVGGPCTGTPRLLPRGVLGSADRLRFRPGQAVCVDGKDTSPGRRDRRGWNSLPDRGEGPPRLFLECGQRRGGGTCPVSVSPGSTGSEELVHTRGFLRPMPDGTSF